MGCFHVMMALAETLQVAWRCEQRPVPFVWDYVVNNCGLSAVARIGCGVTPRALSTERLVRQLVGAESVRPHWQRVPPVICGAHLAFHAWPMLVAPAVARQRGTARAAAWA